MAGLLLGLVSACTGSGDGSGSKTSVAADDTGQADDIAEPYLDWSSSGDGEVVAAQTSMWVGSEEYPSQVLLASAPDLCEQVIAFASTRESIVDGIVEAGGGYEAGVEAAERQFLALLEVPWSLIWLKLENSPDIDELGTATGLAASAFMATRNDGADVDTGTALYEDSWGEVVGGP
ncbi:MAG: hypothetical protein QGG40_15360, partial [Myxococcota bacterium]|nr:hypothetical protein [Myxococcota bacterium]